MKQKTQYVKIKPNVLLFPETYVTAQALFTFNVENISDKIVSFKFLKYQKAVNANSIDKMNVNSPQKKDINSPTKLNVNSSEKKKVNFSNKKDFNTLDKKSTGSPQKKSDNSSEKQKVTASNKKGIISPDKKNINSTDNSHGNSPDKMNMQNIPFMSDNFCFEPSTGKIYPHGSIQIIASFIPSSLGQFEEFSTFFLPEISEFHSITLTGSGIPARAFFNPSSVNIGIVKLGDTCEYEIFLQNSSNVEAFFEIPDRQSSKIQFSFSPKEGVIPPNSSFPVHAFFAAKNVCQFHETYSLLIKNSKESSNIGDVW